MNHFTPIQTIRSRSLKLARTLFLLASLLFVVARAQAQVSVTVTGTGNTLPALSSSYSSLASAITALNTVTSFSGPVTLTCATGTETAPAGGYVINFSGAASAANNIIIDGAGSVITAAAIATATNSTTGTAKDAIISLVGSDYVTIQNFTLNENAANTTGGAWAAQKMTEFGVALFAKSTTDGAQYNTIQNCSINLSNATVKYQNAIGIFSTSASSQTNATLAAASIAGTNSFNKFYGNTITGVAQGFYFISPAQTATVFESGNEIGSATAGTGNTITFGYSNTAGDLPYTSYSGVQPCGIYFRNVVGNSAINNTISNANGLTLTGAGIFAANGTAPSGTGATAIPVCTSNFSFNTITLTQSASIAMTGISFGQSTTNVSIICNNNNISINRTCVLTNSGAISGIVANFTAAASQVKNNTVSIVDYFAPATSISNSGAFYGIRIPGSTNAQTDVYGNTVTINRKLNANAGFITTHSGATYGYDATSACASLFMGDTTAGMGNKLIMWDDYTGAGINYTSGIHYMFNVTASCSTFVFRGNSLSMGANGNRLGLTSTCYITCQNGATFQTRYLFDRNTFNLDRSMGYTGSTYGYYHYGSTPFLSGGYDVTNNTWNVQGPNGNSPLTGSGVYYGIYSYDGVSLQTDKNFSNNTFTGTGAFSTTYGIYSYTGRTINLNNNLFNINSTYRRGTVTTYGVFNAGSATNTKTCNISNNTIEQLTHTDSAYYTVSIYGIYSSGGETVNINNNTVKKISTGYNIKISTPGTYYAQVTGIQVSGGTTTNVFRNNLYNITSSHDDLNSNASGIKITAGTQTNVYNNLINISTPIANMNNRFASVAGFHINCTTTGTTHNIYNNTVYLNTTSTGANFGTAAVYHVANATATTSNLILNNNIFYNNCAPTGSGGSYGMRRSFLAANGLNNYNAASSNNYWFGYTGMYFDSTSAISLADFKGKVSPREAGSITETLTFLNTNNPSLASYMRLDPTIATQSEAGGVTLAGNSTDDYTTSAVRTGYPKTGQNYGGGAAPDMGAFEDDLAPADFTGPNISFTALPNTTNTSAVTLNVTIKDPSGVPTSGLGMPVLYYKNQTATSFSSVQGVDMGAGVFAFTFGGGNAGDAISYYIVAQDNVGNLSAMPSSGIGALTATPPTAASAPTSLNGYFILNTFSGDVKVGGTVSGPTAGCDYVSINEALSDFIPGKVRSIYVLNGGTGYTTAPTVTITGGGGSGAVAYADVNATTGQVTKVVLMTQGSGYSSAPTITLSHPSGSGAVVQLNMAAGKIVTGPSNLILTASYNSNTEGAFPIVVPEITGVSAANPFTIKPDVGVSPIISGSSATSIIQLYAADYITIDGSNSGTTTQDLTINNQNTGANTAGIQVVSVTTGAGASAVINGARNNTFKNINIIDAVSASINYGISIGTTVGAGGANNDSIAIVNNLFTNCSRAIYANGTDSVSKFGLDFITINKNIINYSGGAGGFDAIYLGYALNSSITRNFIDVTTSGTTPVGIKLGTGANNISVDRNYINRLITTNTGGYGAHGIKVGTNLVLSNLSITNNVINNINGTGWSSYAGTSPVGIYLGDVKTGRVNVYHNTVNMYGDYAAGGYNTSAITTALYATSTCTELDVRNNILSNTLRNPNTGTSAITSKNYAIHSDGAPTIFTQLNNNLYFVANTSQGRLAYIALPAAKTDTTLAMIQTDFGQNNASVNANPLFNSSTVIKPQTGSPVLGTGTPIATVTVDYLGTTRSATTPSMGAYEVGGDGAAPVIAFNALANTASTSNITFDVTISDAGTGASGADTTTNLPIVYYKKSKDASVFGVANDSTGNGWKWVQATGAANPFSLTIDVSKLRSAPTMNDVIQYFVVAQDYAGNVGAAPNMAGFEATSVSVVSNPPVPGSFIIVGPPMSGTYTVGTGGTYETITAATNDLKLRGVAGPVIFSLIDLGYTQATETFPINLTRVIGMSPSNTVTFQPAASLINGTIIASNATAASTGIINFDGGDYFVFDGRKPGAGNTKSLTIQNDNASGYVMQLINDAVSNTITYCDIKGAGTGSTTAPLVIYTTTGTTGNDSNTFAYNDIHESVSNPYYCVYEYGTYLKENNMNAFIGNNIYNFGITGSGYGIYSSSYNCQDSYIGNSFYASTARNMSGMWCALYKYNTTDTLGVTISDNYVGGSAPMCAGSPLTFTNNATYITAMYLYFGYNAGASFTYFPTNNITNNTFRNMVINTTSTSTTQTMIYHYYGKSNIRNNTFGSLTANNDIVFNYSGTASGTFAAIANATGTHDTMYIENNTIGGITINQATGTNGLSLRGIDLGGSSTGNFFVNNNTIGGPSLGAMIQNTGNNLLPIINRNSNNKFSTINNNLIQNCISTTKTANVYAIMTGALSGETNYNTIRNITSKSSSTGGALFGIVIGASSGNVGMSVNNNKIYNLYASDSAKVMVCGIVNQAGSSTAPNFVNNNIIDNLYANNPAGGANIYGITVSTGQFIYANNIVRLGLDSNGNAYTRAHNYYGMNEFNGTNKFYYNTLFIAGNTIGDTANSYAFRSFASGTTRDIRNNLFVNKRTNTGSLSMSYAIGMGDTTTTAMNLTLNNNNYFSVGKIGRYKAVDRNTLGDWRIAVGKDANSINENPNFVAPNASLSTADLRIAAGTTSLMESGGAIIPEVTTDFEGNARPGPVGALNGGGLSSDIGADEFDGALFPLNMGVQALASPSGTCATSGKTVSVRIKNYASVDPIDFSVNNVIVSGSVAGPNPITFNPVLITTGVLAPGATMDVVFDNNYNMSDTGSYVFDATTMLIGDASTANDAMPTTTIKITPLTPGRITTDVAQFCTNAGGMPTLTATATGGDIQWLESTNGPAGPWTNVGPNSLTYAPTTAITTTTTYTALATCAGTTIAAGDTVSIFIPNIASFANGTRCGNGPVTMNVTPGYGQTVNWYADSVGGNSLFQGNDYSPVLTKTDTFYASAAAPGETSTAVIGGNRWNQYNTSGMFQTSLISGASMTFNATKKIFLKSVDIYPNASVGTPFTIEVRQTNSTGALIASYTGVTTVTNTGATPVNKQTVPVSFNIPAGNDYVIGFSGTNPGTWRGGYLAGAYGFPHTGPGIVIVNSGYGAATGGTDGYHYYLYNWVVGAACETTRIPVLATVTPSPALSISDSASTTCFGTATANTVQITSTLTDFDTYTWSPNYNVIGSAATGYNFNPDTTLVYTLTASQTGGSQCANTVKHFVKVNPVPSPLSIQQSPLNFCAGSAASPFTIVGGDNQGDANFGDFTGLFNTTATGVTPYSSYYEGAHEQYLVTAAELNAKNVPSGQITAITFNVTSQGAGTFAQSNYTIKMGHTTATQLLGGYVTPTTPFVTVYGPVTEPAPAVGLIRHTFTTNFVWDGFSNVVVDICHDNDINSSCAACYSTNSGVSYTNTSFPSVYGSYNDNAQACGVTASVIVNNNTNRPDMTFSFLVPQNYSWTPLTDLYTDSAAVTAYASGNQRTLFVLPTADRNYSITATNNFNCSTTGTATTKLISAPATPANAAISNVTANSFDFTWDAVADVLGYKVDVATDANFTNFVTGYNNVTAQGTSVSLTGLTAGTEYFVRVRSINTCFTSVNASLNTVTIPETPVLAAATNVTGAGFTVNWSVVAGASEYLVDVSTANDFSTFVTGYEAKSVTSNSAVVTGLNPMSQYYFRVRAANASGASGYSITGDQTTTAAGAKLNLKAYLQGLYLGGGSMTSAPFNADNSMPMTIADTIIVELHEDLSGFYNTDYSIVATIDVNGDAQIELPGSAIGNDYYIAIKHRNSIETWSAAAITIGSANTYDFSTSATQAYGANMVDDGNGVYLIYSGDINQDGFIDGNDFIDVDNDNSNFASGYLYTDANGDAFVDGNDFIVIDNNNSNFIGLARP